jgi:hypothetical protein
MKNLLEYHQYGMDLLPETEVIGAACRVKLFDEYAASIFLQAVEKNLQIADFLVLVNDKSPYAWPTETLEKLSKRYKTPIHVHSNPARSDMNEYRDRQKAFDMCRDEGATWFLSFDSDEVWEDKFNRELAMKLAHPPYPMFFGYGMHFYTFWDREGTMWRADSTFGRMAGVRMARILPGYNMKETESGLHMGNVPYNRVHGCAVPSGIRVKHYGFTRPEERKRKYEFYSEIDTVKNTNEIGFEDYRHLVETNVQLSEWVEDTSLTVGTCVRNEEIGLHDYMRRWWSFADEIVIAHTSSEDRTLEVLKHWDVKVIEYEEEYGEPWDPTLATEHGDLARARNLVLKNCKTRWYLQMDIDEHPILTDRIPDAHSHIRRILDKVDREGWQFFFRNLHPAGFHTLSQTPRLIRDPEEKRYFGYSHETLDQSLPEKSLVDYSELQFAHTGALMEEDEYKEKIKAYFRGNLRMIQDFPNEPKGWFNASMHLLDAGPEYRPAGLMFIQQALVRKANYAVARKELIVQALTDVGTEVQKLGGSVPPGHPFQKFAQEILEATEGYRLQSREHIRCPEHAMEVLNEPQFKEFLDMIEHIRMRNQGDSDGAEEEQPGIVQGGAQDNGGEAG